MKIAVLCSVLMLSVLGCKTSSETTSKVAAAAARNDVPSGCYSVWSYDDRSPDDPDFRGRSASVSLGQPPLDLPGSAVKVCLLYNGTLKAWSAAFFEEAVGGQERRYEFRESSSGGFKMNPAGCPARKTCRLLTVRVKGNDVPLLFVSSGDFNWNLKIGPGGTSREYTLMPQTSGRSRDEPMWED